MHRNRPETQSFFLLYSIHLECLRLLSVSSVQCTMTEMHFGLFIINYLWMCVFGFFFLIVFMLIDSAKKHLTKC